MTNVKLLGPDLFWHQAVSNSHQPSNHIIFPSPNVQFLELWPIKGARWAPGSIPCVLWRLSCPAPNLSSPSHAPAAGWCKLFNTCLPPTDHILKFKLHSNECPTLWLYIHMLVNISFYLVLNLFLLLHSLAPGAQTPPHVPDNCTVQYLLTWCLEIRSVPKKVS